MNCELNEIFPTFAAWFKKWYYLFNNIIIIVVQCHLGLCKIKSKINHFKFVHFLDNINDFLKNEILKTAIYTFIVAWDEVIKELDFKITNLSIIQNVKKITENSAKIKNLYKKQRFNFQKIGINKYDAFQEMGGNLSFALALLDENDNGFIINSVHNIQSSYCYAKEVKGGKCSINLSKDEEIALDKALNGS